MQHGLYFQHRRQQPHHRYRGKHAAAHHHHRRHARHYRLAQDRAAGRRRNGYRHTRNRGRYSLIINNKSYEVFARRLNKPDEGESQTYEIFFAGQRFEVQVEDERTRSLTSAAASAHSSGEARIRAPMSGLVIGVPFESGASVTRGQTVVILEAMKMENDLSTPINGTIKEIRVSKGQTVNQGDVLVVVAGE